MRAIDSKYQVEGDQIIKTSNGEVVQLSEPTFLFRARDPLAVKALDAYRQLCLEAGCTQYQIDLLDGMIGHFARFAQMNPDAMKMPGVTKGK